MGPRKARHMGKAPRRCGFIDAADHRRQTQDKAPRAGLRLYRHLSRMMLPPLHAMPSITSPSAPLASAPPLAKAIYYCIFYAASISAAFYRHADIVSPFHSLFSPCYAANMTEDMASLIKNASCLEMQTDFNTPHTIRRGQRARVFLHTELRSGDACSRR